MTPNINVTVFILNMHWTKKLAAASRCENSFIQQREGSWTELMDDGAKSGQSWKKKPVLTPKKNNVWGGDRGQTSCAEGHKQSPENDWLLPAPTEVISRFHRLKKQKNKKGNPWRLHPPRQPHLCLTCCPHRAATDQLDHTPPGLKTVTSWAPNI